MGMRIVAVLLIVAMLPACFGYVNATGPTPERLDALRAAPRPIRVTLADARSVDFREPLIRSDSILEAYEYGHGEAVALADVTHIQDRDFQQWRTAFLFAIPAALAGLIALLVAIGPMPPS
jgi:hypothetical protein